MNPSVIDPAGMAMLNSVVDILSLVGLEINKDVEFLLEEFNDDNISKAGVPNHLQA